MSASSGKTSSSGRPSASASRAADQPLGRAVEDRHAALAVDADDAGRGAGQHRFGEAAAAVDQVARAHDVVALRAQLGGHAIEGLAELGEIAFRLAHRHAHIEIAGGHDIGGADQAADGRDQHVGEIEPDPDRGEQHGERDDGVHQREGDLHAEPARLQRGVFAHARARRLQLRHHARIEQPRDVEPVVGIFLQLDDGGDVIGVGQQHDLRVSWCRCAAARRAAAWRRSG